MLLFAPTEAEHLAEPLARELKTGLAALEDRRFEDGEGKLRPLVSVRGQDVYVIQSLSGDDKLSIHDRLCRLLFLMATLRDHGAKRVTAVTPYLCYARKDRRTKSRDPLTLRYLAQLVEAVGCDCLISLEVHNLMAFQNAFRCQTYHINLGTAVIDAVSDGLTGAPLTVMSPDPGGIKRAQLFREALEAQIKRPVHFAFLDKRRSAGLRTEGALSGDVSERQVVIVDDMIATGGTLLSAAEACRENGATGCIALAAHGLFSDGSSALLQSDALEKIIVTDSVGQAPDGVQTVSCAPALATAIRRISGTSVDQTLRDGEVP